MNTKLTPYMMAKMETMENQIIEHNNRWEQLKEYIETEYSQYIPNTILNKMHELETK